MARYTCEVKLKNLSNHTFLNGKSLTVGEVALSHGDIIKIGERLARWEYIPSSKYYPQDLSSSSRLVAVVKPQQRSVNSEINNRPSAIHQSLCKQIVSGTKRRFSERAASEVSSYNRTTKFNSTGKIPNSVGMLHHQNFKSAKMLFSPKGKGKKTISGETDDVSFLKSPAAGPSDKNSIYYKKKVATPPSTNPKSVRRKSTPMKKVLPMTSLGKGRRKSNLIKPLNLKSIIEFSPKEDESSPRAGLKLIESPSPEKRESISVTPKKKTSLRSERLVKSEMKINTKGRDSLVGMTTKIGRLSLTSNAIGKTPRISSLKRTHKTVSRKSESTPVKTVNQKLCDSDVKDMDDFSGPKKTGTPQKTAMKSPRKSPMTTLQKTPKKTPKRNSLRKSVLLKNTPAPSSLSSSNQIQSISSSEKINNKRKSDAVTSPMSKTSLSLTPKRIKQSGTLGLTAVENTPSSETFKSNLFRKSFNSPDSLADESAKKAALKLKSSSPKKPDKNKKAALLVLGKANRKQLASQNIKISLKQKIVKKAIKHSVPTLKNNKYPTVPQRGRPKTVKALKKVMKKGEIKRINKSSVSLPSPSNIISPRGIKHIEFEQLTPEKNEEVWRKVPRLVQSSKKVVSSKRKGKPSRGTRSLGNTLQAVKTPDAKQLQRKSKILVTPIRTSHEILENETPQSVKNMKSSPAAVTSPRKSPRSELKAEETETPSKNTRTPNKSINLSEKTQRLRTPQKTPKVMDVSPKMQVTLKTPEHTPVSLEKCTGIIKQEKLRSLEKQSEKPVSPSKMNKTPLSLQTSMNENPNSFSKFSEISDSYFFSSNRRCSKRLSSKNDVGKPDYMELSPTALGLIPKHAEEIFKTPKEKKKRRSISLTTPKNNCTAGIIKSASTMKIRNRKSVRFSPKNLAISQDFVSDILGGGTPFRFEDINTPDISLDVFVSPLTQSTRGKVSVGAQSTSTQKEKGSFGKKSVTELGLLKDDAAKTKCARKLLHSPEFRVNKTAQSVPLSGKRKSSFGSSEDSSKRRKSESSNYNKRNEVSGTPKKMSPDMKAVSPRKDKSVEDFSSPSRSLRQSPQATSQTKTIKKTSTPSKSSPMKITRQKSPRNDLNDVEGVHRLLKTPRIPKSPKNDLTNIDGVRQLLKTPRVPKSPKNELSDLRGVKKLMTTPKVQKHPKNDLSDLKGVKKLLTTPKLQKPPKNDLSDLKGVKKLLATPKLQKPPKNDLSDLKGVKKLLTTPKLQKPPKNDLSDLKGVKKLLTTPKLQKPPKNDLSDLKGVKKLLTTPKLQKPPKNDLSDLRGVKKLLSSPKVQKNPKNELNDLRGVKTLLGTPKQQKGPKNELSDLRGVKKLLSSPKVQKSPKNELIDVRGVKHMFSSPRAQKTPKNDLTDVDGVRQLLKTPRVQRGPKNDLGDLRGVKNLLRTPRVQKEPKNDISDLRGVRKLLASPRPKKIPKNELSDLEGVAQLFELEEKISPLLSSKKSPGVTSRKVKKQVLISESPTQDNEGTTKVTKRITGRRTTYASPDASRNATRTKVRKLFSRKSELDISLTGVAQLFDLPIKGEDVRKSPGNKRSTRSRAISGERKPAKEDSENKKVQRSTRRGSSKSETKATSSPTLKRKTKRNAAVRFAEPEEIPVSSNQKTTRKKSVTPAAKEEIKEAVGRKRGRSATIVSAEISPQKRRRKEVNKSEADLDPQTTNSKTSTGKKPASKTRTPKKAKTPVKRGKSPAQKVNSVSKEVASPKVQKKSAPKAATKSIPKKTPESKRKSRATEVSVKISPRKTRSRANTKTANK
ncbi:hypothetical protein RUM43_013228 [Polyplax serrata]|uniref:Antigen KI-67 n=1 Tax=Polyplax serrata TaxID=468196 RepID=A0AAN8NK59_POLSC